jgi:hypothetical protein
MSRSAATPSVILFTGVFTSEVRCRPRFGVMFAVFTTLRSCFDPRKRHPVKAAEVPARIRAQPAELVLDA